MAEGNRDYLAQLLYDRKLADFLKSAPDTPRAHFDAMESPNLGHAYGIPLTWSMSATMLIDYAHYYGHPKRNQLFNVRYTITRKDKPRAAPAVYTDNAWNVYENPDVLGRAWIVHQVEVDASNKRLDDAAFDLSQNATLQEPPSFPKHTTKEGKPGEVRWLSYQPNSLEVETTTDSPGMLILSEVFYPGWTCTVDGVPTKIYRADAVLRGVPVGAGTHRVSMRYRPASVMWGAAFSISSLIGILCWAGIRRWKSQASTVY
jgi:hypothetical protein